MSSSEKIRNDNVLVQEFANISSQSQTELIADRFAEVSQQYQPLKSEDILLPNLLESKPLPLFESQGIHCRIKKMKKMSSTIAGVIPWRISSAFSMELSEPISHMFNSALLSGIWPDSWKHEQITPVR